MKKAQIKELAQSIAVHDAISANVFNWISDKLNRDEKKSFIRLLSREIKDMNVIASFAGNVDEKDKNKIASLFPNKKISFKRDDETVVAGIRIEYGDFVLDYTVAGVIKRILSRIREKL